MSDFPDLPTIGDYVTKGGVTWQWDGDAWVIVGSQVDDGQYRWETVVSADLTGLDGYNHDPSPDEQGRTIGYRVSVWADCATEQGLFVRHNIDGASQTWNRIYSYWDETGSVLQVGGSGNVTGGLAGYVNRYGQIRSHSFVNLFRDPTRSRWSYTSYNYGINNFGAGQTRLTNSTGYTEPVATTSENRLTRLGIYMSGGAVFASGFIIIEALMRRPEQSGKVAGVADSGIDANGISWVKYDDGRMECWGEEAITGDGTGFFWHPGTTFPFPFTDYPVVTATPNRSARSEFATISFSSEAPPSVGSMRILLTRYNATFSDTRYVGWHAKGYWK